MTLVTIFRKERKVMEKYKDTDIINDAIDFMRSLSNKPLLTVWVTETSSNGWVYEGMKYYSSSTVIEDNKMVRTLNLDGEHLVVEVKNIKELHVFWDHSKYKLPQYLLDPVVNYPAPADGETVVLTNAGMQATMKKKPKLTAPPLRKISIGGIE